MATRDSIVRRGSRTVWLTGGDTADSGRAGTDDEMATIVLPDGGLSRLRNFG